MLYILEKASLFWGISKPPLFLPKGSAGFYSCFNTSQYPERNKKDNFSFELIEYCLSFLLKV